MIFLSDITLQHGSRRTLENASLQILDGSRIGIVGPNGAGKTTLLRLIVGKERPDNGTINRSKNLVVGYFSQSVGEMSGRTALEEVMAVAEDVMDLGRQIREIEVRMAEPADEEQMAQLLDQYGDCLSAFEHRGGYDLESRAQAVLTGLGIGPDDYLRPVESFSGGWKMRIALARILTLNPDVLLLDEPTNHLDVESIVWLEQWLLSSFAGALVMTSHDRVFLNRVITSVTEVAGGAVTSYSGNYDFYIREREIRRTQLLATQRRQNEMVAKDEEFIARFKARASHAAQVQSRIKKLEKIDRVEVPSEPKRMQFAFAVSPRSGDEVLNFKELGKVWTDVQGDVRVFGGASGLIRRGDRVAVTGVNGAGKSTFLKVLAGRTEPTGGALTRGTNVHVGYFSQHAMEVLHPEKTIFETLYDALPEASVGSVRSLCGAFLFRGEDADKKIRVLSGGEKSRVVLATLLASPVNLLVLDEPTNHLDIVSREILLDALSQFQGTVVLVSHDRFFLRALANRVFEIDRGTMTIFEEGYDDYLERKSNLSMSGAS